MQEYCFWFIFHAIEAYLFDRRKFVLLYVEKTIHCEKQFLKLTVAFTFASLLELQDKLFFLQALLKLVPLVKYSFCPTLYGPTGITAQDYINRDVISTMVMSMLPIPNLGIQPMA